MKIQVAILFVLVILPSFPLLAQETNSNVDYYYVMDEEGNPRFNQIISWENLPGSLGYELIVKDLENRERYRRKTAEPSQEVSLEPGHYLYSVIVYNLLDKPEYKSPWTPLRIYKAERPVVEKITPDNLYIEENDYKITLEGTGLLPFSEYWLINMNRDQVLGRLEDFEIPKDGVVKITLPKDMNKIGTYTVKVQNPGGMSSTASDSYNIRYRKPFDISFSLGYSPFFSLYDSWFTTYFDDVFHAAGTQLRADFIFLKTRYGYFGLELQGEGIMNFEGGIEDAQIESYFYGGGLNLLYKYPYTEKMHLLTRWGGGIAYSSFSFDYSGVSGTSFTTWNPYITGGFSLQYYFKNYLYGEGGFDWKHVFYDGTSWGTLSPSISLGVTY